MVDRRSQTGSQRAGRQTDRQAQILNIVHSVSDQSPITCAPPADPGAGALIMIRSIISLTVFKTERQRSPPIVAANSPSLYAAATMAHALIL